MTRLLWALAVLLAGALAAEFALPGPPRPSPVTAPPTPDPAAATAAAEPVASWIATALQRPLFNPDRRPAAPGAAPAVSAAHPEPPRLAGILITPEGRNAIFAGSTDSEHATLAHEGSRVGAWVVQAIRVEDVQLAGPGGLLTVRPTYSSAPPPQAPAVTQAAPGSLLPQRAQADTRPFNSLSQPSGADIFKNASPLPVSRNTK